MAKGQDACIVLHRRIAPCEVLAGFDTRHNTPPFKSRHHPNSRIAQQLGYGTIRYNLSESSVTDRPVNEFVKNFDDVLLCYGDHCGDPSLRESIASSGTGLTADHVLVTSGAASALFIIATSLLEKSDHLVVVRPNYTTNIETPKAIGAEITYIDVTFEEGYRLNPETLRAAVRPETKYISLTYPHNPTGVSVSTDEMKELIQIADDAGCVLLFDETYREMSAGEMLPVAASLSPDVISVSSLSKSYGIPGIRVGWLITQNAELMNLFLSTKEQICITGSIMDEHIASIALSQRDEWTIENNKRIGQGLKRVKDWIAQEDAVEWVEPVSGCVCFPRINPNVEIDLDAFYRTLYEVYQTYVGAGHWFDMSPRHFRIGYAWSTLEELENGLESISKAIRDTRTN